MVREPVLYGKYLLLDRVSVGGMAEVFKAKSFGVEGFQKIVAIKRILPSMAEDADFIQMFIDEAKIAGQLNHANVCQIFELGRIEESHFIAMEYISGKDLLQIMTHFNRNNQLIPIPYACYMMAKLCEGLEYAHRKTDTRGRPLNIIHRDISPQNVIVSYEGEIKIIDFGIAKAAQRSSQTAAGVLKGKFGYMSPEQVLGESLDRRSDVFALGTLLYEMVTGVRLFHAESDFAILEKVRNCDFEPPSVYNRNIPKDLEAAILGALARDPRERFQWASELQEAIQMVMVHHKPIVSAKRLAGFMKQHFAGDIRKEREAHERFMQLEHPDDPALAASRKLPDFDDFDDDEATEVRKDANADYAGGALRKQSTEIFFENEEATSGGTPIPAQEPDDPATVMLTGDEEPATMMLTDDVEQPTMMLPDEGGIPQGLQLDAAARAALEGRQVETAPNAAVPQPPPAFREAETNVGGMPQPPPEPPAPAVVDAADPFAAGASAGLGDPPVTSAPASPAAAVSPATGPPPSRTKRMIGLLVTGLLSAVITGVCMVMVLKGSPPRKPPPPPPPKAAMTLLVQAEGPVTVLINGAPQGNTGTKGAMLLQGMPAGTYEIGLQAKGYLPFKTKVELKPGDVKLLGPYQLKSTAKPSLLTVSLPAQYKDARVVLNGRLLMADEIKKPLELPLNKPVEVRVTNWRFADIVRKFPPSHDKKFTIGGFTMEPAKEAQLWIDFTPANAAVSINGKKQKCASPCHVRGLPRGKVTILLERNGFRKYERSYSLRRQRFRKLDIVMDPTS